LTFLLLTHEIVVDALFNLRSFQKLIHHSCTLIVLNELG